MAEGQTLTPEQLVERLEQAGRGGSGGNAFQRYLLREVIALGLDGENYAKRAVTSRLRMRTGRLRNSIRHSARNPQPGVLLLSLLAGGNHQGGRVPYARVQEYGGTVRPKKGRYLTIPIGPAKTRGAGDARRPGPRDYPNLVFVQSLRGQPLLVDRDSGVPYFLLRRQVKLKGRFFMRSAFKQITHELPAAISDALAVAVEAP